MKIAVGDIITIKIIEVSGYGCWGEVNGLISFTHCVDWSIEKPVSEKYIPKVGQRLKVKVFHVSNNSDESQPADVTMDGKFNVDFAASFII